MEKTKEAEYQRELFDKVKESASLKREEDSLGAYLKAPVQWWLIDKPHPILNDLKKGIYDTCQFRKKIRAAGISKCLEILSGALKTSVKTRSVARFDCGGELRGFVYPIAQGDRLYGYLGACHAKEDVAPEVLNIFSAFTDSIVKIGRASCRERV